MQSRGWTTFGSSAISESSIWPTTTFKMAGSSPNCKNCRTWERLWSKAMRSWSQAKDSLMPTKYLYSCSAMSEFSQPSNNRLCFKLWKCTLYWKLSNSILNVWTCTYNWSLIWHSDPLLPPPQKAEWQCFTTPSVSKTISNTENRCSRIWLIIGGHSSTQFLKSKA